MAPGQRGGIDDMSGAVAIRIGQGVCQDQPAFGIGIENFDRFAGERCDDIAGALGFAVDHVLNERRVTGDRNSGFQLRDGAHGPDHSSGARHVVLHFFHAVARLDRDAAGIEGDSFAEKREVVPSFGARRPVGRA